MSWELLTFVATVSRAFFGVAQKDTNNRLKEDVSAITQGWLMNVSGLALLGLSLLPTVVISGFPHIGGFALHDLWTDWRWLIAGGMSTCYAAGTVLTFFGIAGVQAGVAQVAMATTLVWSTALAWLPPLRANFSGWQFVGIAFLGLGVFVAQFRKGYGFNRKILLIFAAAASFSGFQLLSAILAGPSGQGLGTGMYLLIARIGPIVLLPITAFIWGKFTFAKIRADIAGIRRRPRDVVITSFYTGLASFLYLWWSYLAYRTAPNRGIVVIPVSLQAVGAVFLSAWLLKEKTSFGRALAGGLIAFAAAWLIIRH